MRFFIFYLITFCCYCPLYIAAQTTILPTIMLIPYVKETEDIRSVCDKDANKRFALSKAKEYFDNHKFKTIDFLAKLKNIESNAAFTAENQANIQTEIIAMSGCDVYIVVDVDAKKYSFRRVFKCIVICL